MPRGDWRKLVYLVGWLALSDPVAATVSQPSPKADPRQAQATNAVQEREPPIARPVPPVEPFESPDYERPCEPGADNRDSDLCAQWKAADAATSAAFWAKLSFVLGIFGTVGLFWTVYYTRRAVRLAIDASQDADQALVFASRNADAAAAQVKVAQETAESQLRAYVYVGMARLIWGTPKHMKDEVRNHAHIHVFYKNFGGTPAIDCVTRCVATVAPYPWEGERPLIEGIAAAASEPTDLPQGHEVSQIIEVKNLRSHLPEIREGREALYVFAQVAYTTFKRHHTGNFDLVSVYDDLDHCRFREFKVGQKQPTQKD